jgi:hypothetical protein
VRVRLEAAYEDPERQVFLLACDLSETGAWLQTSDPPLPGRRARITLELPGHGPLMHLAGTVVRRRIGESEGFALQFDAAAASDEARAALRGFVARTLSRDQ